MTFCLLLSSIYNKSMIKINRVNLQSNSMVVKDNPKDLFEKGCHFSIFSHEIVATNRKISSPTDFQAANLLPQADHSIEISRDADA